MEVQLLDGSVRMIPFDASAIAAPASVPQARAVAAAECSPCSYTDGDGVYHLVESAEEIPAQYRSKAGRIRGSIQRADATPVTYRPPSFSERTEPAQRVDLARLAAPEAPPVPSGPPVYRNELGEDFIQYATRLRGQQMERQAREGR